LKQLKKRKFKAMKERFRAFPNVSSKHGAPMGRMSSNADFSDVAEHHLCVSKPQGEYDCGGAYWGLGGRSGEGPVYAVWVRGQGKELGVKYVRAISIKEAKNKARGLGDAD
jgi:hypothetical protein